MAKRAGGLGRGLGSILNDPSVSGEKKKEIQKKVSINEIPVNKIVPNRFQPRTDFDPEAISELADSIKHHGIIQPITVRKLDNEEYELISGERRLRASKQAKLKTIPAYIREANDKELVMLALIENVWREDLNPIEIALSYQRMKTELKLTQKELEQKVEKKRSTIANYLGLLDLPDSIRAALKQNEGNFSMGHAKALKGIKEIDAQLSLFEEIKAKKLSVRQTEDWVKALKDAQKKGKAAPDSKDAESKIQDGVQQKLIREVEQKLQDKLQAKVQINQKAGSEKGEIRVKFSSGSELNEILEILGII
jgi:ParB family chromosome partitioning protein